MLPVGSSCALPVPRRTLQLDITSPPRTPVAYRPVTRLCAAPSWRGQSTGGLDVKAQAVTGEEITKGKERLPLFCVDQNFPVSVDEDENCGVFVDRDGNFIETMCCDYGYRSGGERMYTYNETSIPGGGFALASKNFVKELANLRFMFRDDEFAAVSELNPPKSWIGKAAYGVGKGLVSVMANIDRGLEKVGVLPDLRAPPPEPQDPEEQNIKAQAEKKDLVNSVRPDCINLRAKLKTLKLSNAAVWKREHARENQGEGVATPWYVKGVYLSLCILLDVLFNNRPIQRFWFLETVARMPYFSYITCLHLYESLGWWRAGAELRKIHFAEEWNELHHLQIMESLGGDRLWADRFFAYHSAIIYYWLLVAIFIINPGLAYNFSELIESHAVDTYGEFCDANEELLKSMPPPLVAVQYYRSNDLYMFDEFQTSKRAVPRSPATNTLYDVFINIRDDEGEHVKTMVACQDNSVASELAARKDTPRRL